MIAALPGIPFASIFSRDRASLLLQVSKSNRTEPDSIAALEAFEKAAWPPGVLAGLEETMTSSF
nr:hypothetical protein TQ38_05220 [Novosphingobium sp. P6W]